MPELKNFNIINTEDVIYIVIYRMSKNFSMKNSKIMKKICLKIKTHFLKGGAHGLVLE
jgi:hypothetical protein